jgi:riboflavin synthase
MFTGLIEEIGVVKSIVSLGGGKSITIEAKKIMDDIKIDDSVAVDGACQTVVHFDKNTIKVEAIEETLLKTTLGSFRVGKKVNLERAAKLGDRMGGHLVQGHVDCKGIVKSIDEKATEVQIWIEFPLEFDKYIIPVGSIAVNGVSLTVAKVSRNQFMLTIIPHTWKVTNLYMLKPGSLVNLEFDLIGKYVEKMISPQKKSTNSLEKYIDQPDY